MITSFNIGTPRKSTLTPEILVVCFHPSDGAPVSELTTGAAAVTGAFCGFGSGVAALRAGSSSGSGTDCCCMPAHAICPGIRREKRRALKRDLSRIMFVPFPIIDKKLRKKREQPAKELLPRLLRHQRHRRLWWYWLDWVYAQDTPDSLIELEALVCPEQVVAWYVERPAGSAGRDDIEVTSRTYAHLRSLPLGTPVIHQVISGDRIVCNDCGTHDRRGND